MKRKAKLERAIEAFVLVTFPIALMVGCAGSGNVQPELEKTKEISSIEQHYNMDDIYPLFADNDSNLDIVKMESDIAIAKVETSKVDTPKMDTKPDMTVEATIDNVAINEPTDSMLNVSFISAETETTTADATVQADVITTLMNEIKIQPDYLVFNFDSDSVKVHGYDHYFLKQHAEYLKTDSDLILKISGHTDSRGSVAYNEKLSQKRAATVKDILITLGAPEAQIQLKGLGEVSPISEESKMKDNRRVELEYIDHTMISAM